MLTSLVRLSLRYRLLLVVFSAGLLGFGLYTAKDMPIDVFPDLTAPTVSILVEGHGMAPEEMETLVTFPIEAAVNGAADVRRVRSATAVGISVIWVDFDWGTEIYRARQTITERLAALSGSLPEQVDAPILAPVTSIMGEILFLGLTSDRHDPMELRVTAESQIARRLLAVEGVAKISPIGGEVKQFQAVLSPQRLRAFGISVEEVAEALRRNNENVSAGVLVDGGSEALLRGIGRVQTTEEIAEILVRKEGSKAITVGDLGVVQIGPALRRGTASASRRGSEGEAITESGVVLAVLKQPSANTLRLTQELDLTIAEIQAGLPKGMVINSQLFRQADFIETAVKNANLALLEGGLMVVLVVLLFLVSMRASVITLLAIPISLVIALFLLQLFGSSINTMTLGGMAIAIGALVDDAIIDVENVIRRLRENRSKAKANQRNVLKVILDASIEVRHSIVFATLIIILVFSPLFALSGVEGRLLQPLGIAFCVALAASLLTALTLTPALCMYLLPESKTVTGGKEGGLVRGLKKIYAGPLDWALRHPWLVTAPVVLLLVGAGVGVANMGRSFLPEFHEGAMVVGVVTLPGTSLEESDRVASEVERVLMTHAEIIAIGRRTGRAEADEHVMGVESSEFELTLDMEAPERLGLAPRTRQALLEALRADVAKVPGVQATFGQPISHRIDHMLSGTRANLAVKIFGPDLRALRTLAAQSEGLLQSVPGLVDLSVEQQVDLPQWRVEWDRAALARYGIPLDQASNKLDAAFRGQTVGQILEGKNAYDMVVRVESGMSASAVDIPDVVVTNDQGAQVPIRALARVIEDSGPNLIMRENVQRKIVVMANVAGRDLASVVAEVQDTIAESLDLPTGYFVEYGGQFESAEATNRRLAIFGVAVLVGMAMLLYLMFRSRQDVLLIMLNLPLALIGGVVGVYLSGGVLSVASIIGFISVFGIAARNGIMLVSHVRHLQGEQPLWDFLQCVRQGSMERLAPILMTAAAAGFALIPMAMKADEPGTEILAPMAMVILFGLLSSTFLNMLTIPTLLYRFGAKQA
jgi:CzcA family heavy metal efflux pump